MAPPETIDEFVKKLGDVPVIRISSVFSALWGQHDGDPITGKETYPSYKYRDGFAVATMDGDKTTPAIIKGIWTENKPNPREEKEVIDNGFYLKTWEELDSKNGGVPKLLAFGINPGPSNEDLPNFFFIIEDSGFFSQQEGTRTKSADNRKKFKDRVQRKYDPNLSW